MRHTRARAAALALALFAPMAAAQLAFTPTPGDPTPAARGIAGSVEVTSTGPRLRADPAQTLASPILVRIAESRPAGEGATTYRIEFIGVVAGTYNLRDALQNEDGSPASALPPLPVNIYTQLPPNHGTDVYGLADPPFRLVGWYREFMVAAAVLWIAVPVAVVARRRLRRRPPPAAAPVVPPPTLADLLRPLVEAAQARAMTIAERGRLELLLYSYWREHLGITRGTQAEVIAHLRGHPQAGRLLLAVERWLHQPQGGGDSPDDDVASLLEPFSRVTLSPKLLSEGAAA